MGTRTVRATTKPTEQTTEGGDLTTTPDQFARVVVPQSMAVAHKSTLKREARPLPTRCRPFRKVHIMRARTIDVGRTSRCIFSEAAARTPRAAWPWCRALEASKPRQGTSPLFQEGIGGARARSWRSLSSSGAPRPGLRVRVLRVPCMGRTVLGVTGDYPSVSTAGGVPPPFPVAPASRPARPLGGRGRGSPQMTAHPWVSPLGAAGLQRRCLASR